eukprot:201930_1
MIDTIFKQEKQKYRRIKTDLSLAKDPAIKELIFFHGRERANHLRGCKQKPCGIGSHDFRNKATNVLNADTYFPQMWISREGLSIPSNEYVEINSIVLVLREGATQNDRAEPWWYLRA